jgi:CcmD family protein
MSEGVIVGGWSYVVAAYSITVAGLLGYLWSLRRRKNQIDNED